MAAVSIGSTCFKTLWLGGGEVAAVSIGSTCFKTLWLGGGEVVELEYDAVSRGIASTCMSALRVSDKTSGPKL